MTSEAKHWERQARVVNVIRGRKPYAVVSCDEIKGSITFSLDPASKIWREDELPKSGTMVILSDIRKSDSGWRAHKARFLRPEDE